MNHIIITAALATADALEQRAANIRAEVAKVAKPVFTADTINDIVKNIKKDRAKVKRDLSPEARKRIADAQKKRWAKFRSGK